MAASVLQYQFGASVGHPGGNPNPPKRGIIRGWTQPQVNRMEKFLWSVSQDERLDGFGYAITLTMRDAPASAAEFHRLRQVWIARARRSGLVRLFWVIEWTSRKIPHLHLAAYWPEELTVLQKFRLQQWWVDIAEDYGVRLSGQYVKDVTGIRGWMEYLTKHSARGVAHYQRAGIPPGWESSGRLWGKIGDWPTEVPIEATITTAAKTVLRRSYRSWRVAKAREALYRAQKYGENEKNLQSRRRALVWARRSNRVRKDGFPLPGAKANVPQAPGLRLLAHAASVSEAPDSL